MSVEDSKTPIGSDSPLTALTPASPNITGPFTDLVGRCFLRLCLWVDYVAAWRRTRHAQYETREGSLLGWRSHLHVTYRMSPWLGAGSCVAAAAGMTLLFYASSFKTTLPFAFLAIIALVAMVFGRVAGVLGTVTASLIFASVLFEPRPSLAIEDPVAKAHLIWMLVIGIVVSDLIGRRKVNEIGGASSRQSDHG